MNRQQKLRTLLELEGYDADEAFLEAVVTDSVCPSICMNDGCNYTLELEPDQRRGYCDECRTNSMVSGLVLMGMI